MNDMVVHDDINEAIKSSIKGVNSRLSVLQISSALCAGRVIAEGIAQVPLKTHRPLENSGSELARDHSAYNLLTWAPSEFQTSFEFREMMTMQAVFAGNAYAFINRVNGQVKELIPLDPSTVTIKRNDHFEIVYQVRDPSIGFSDTFRKDEIIHLRGPSLNSLKGVDIQRVCAVVLGLTSELQNYQKRNHERNTKPDGILSCEGELGKEKRDAVASGWEKKFGANGKGGVAVLEDIWKYAAISVSSADSQTIESREFQINEVARMFRVFPQMLMQSAKSSTYASAEQFFQAHVTHTLMPWSVRWEQVLKRDLFGIQSPEYAKHHFTALLRGTSKDRAEYYRTMVELGIYSRNEIRKLEDLNPVEGLDEHLVPLNMGQVGQDNGATNGK